MTNFEHSEEHDHIKKRYSRQTLFKGIGLEDNPSYSISMF